MVLEEEQKQEESCDGLEEAASASDERGVAPVGVTTPPDDDDDADADADPNGNNDGLLEKEREAETENAKFHVIDDNQEEMNKGGESPSPSQSPSPSPTGGNGNGSDSGGNNDGNGSANGGNNGDGEAEEQLKPKPKPDKTVIIDNPVLVLEKEAREELEEDDDDDEATLNRATGMEPQLELVVGNEQVVPLNQKSFLLDPNSSMADESGSEEDQAAFMKELEVFHKERCLEFKPPKFYGEPLNCLKLWRAVIRLGGYEQVTSCKLWREVGASFKPPKTCTTVSWTFRCFYEKALLEYEKYKMSIGELPFTDASGAEPSAGGKQTSLTQAPGSGRARRDAAARAMQGWHSQRLLGNGEVGDPIIKDKNSNLMSKREKQFKSIGLLKRKKPSSVERAVKVARMKASKPQSDSMVVDIGPPADWVKINVQRTKDCFEVYALVPGLLREEVRVQSDPAGRLVISGQPEQLDNPWGVTPFKKVVSLPARIDPHQTSAVVTLHGQLFVRVPFEQLDL